MPRRNPKDSQKDAKKGLDARLELLIRNDQFKQDLVNGQEMYSQYSKAPGPVYCPPDSKDPNYHEWMARYSSIENQTKRQEMRTQKNLHKVKYVHYLAKWDLNWGPWEYVDTKNVDFPTLSPNKLKMLFKRAMAARDQQAERDWWDRRPSPPTMFRLPVDSWDPVERERERCSHLAPADYDPPDGEGYDMPEEVLDDLVPGKVGKKLILELNLTFPRDVLEALIQLKLKEVFDRRKQLKKRQRWDKIDFQIRVFDLAKKKLTFPLIRTQFAKHPRLSTVKSAYLSICQKINSINSSPSTSAEPLDDPKPHDTAKCPQCKSATTFPQMCDQAKKFAIQDYKSAPSKTSQPENWASLEGKLAQKELYGGIRKAPTRSDD